MRRPAVGNLGWVTPTTSLAGRAQEVSRLTWRRSFWVLVLASRLSSCSKHLYDANQTGWLGVARIAMGWPLTEVGRGDIRPFGPTAGCAREHAEETGDRRGTRRRCNPMPTATDTYRPLIAVGGVLGRGVSLTDRWSTGGASDWQGVRGGLALPQWVVDGYRLSNQ